MDSRTFFEKVALMRREQKEYFKTRSPGALRRSQRIEAEIDREIERVRSKGFTAPSPPQQPGLF